MTICLFEDDAVAHLRPLVDTRAAYDLRLAIRTLRETIVDAFEPDQTLLHTRSPVAGVTAVRSGDAARVNSLPNGHDVLFVNGRFVAEEGPVVNRIRRAPEYNEKNVAFVDGDTLVAAWVTDAARTLPDDVLAGEALTLDAFADCTVVELPAQTGGSAKMIGRLWHLIDELPPALVRDIATRRGSYNILDDIYDRPDTDVHDSVVAVAPEQIVLEPGVTVHPGAILDARDGPIYVDADATIYDRAVVKGPCYVGPKTEIKSAADVQACAFGTYCKVGGEVHDTIFQDLSNKSHAGFLGHSYLGRWCNLGADTNTSNLKNDYGEVSLYDAAEGDFLPTGRQFMGLVMGDHAKCGINTMFNTGTVVGACCNVYGANFPPRYLPPFTWGSPNDGFVPYRLPKALEVAERVMARRNRPFTDAHRANLEALFTATQAEREAHGVAA